MDKVSIVLPTHNGSRYLRQSIDSCLNQTYPNIELIVVDDGSADETSAILQSYDDPRLIVLRHETNRGLPATLNTGFAHATGQYLTWTSDDNYYAPEAIQALVMFLEQHPGVDFVYSDYWEIDDQGTVLREVHVNPPESLRQGNCVGPSFLYWRVVYECIGDHNLEARLVEDYEYWLRVAREFRLEPYHQSLYYYRLHSRSLTAERGWYPAARAAARIRKRLGWVGYGEYARALAKVDVCEAFDSYARGDLVNVRRRVATAIIRNPSWLTNVGVLSILLESLVGSTVMGAIRKAKRSLCVPPL